MDQLYQEIEFKDEQIKKLRESLDDCTKNLSVARVS
jgi:hypothetical protein